VTAPKLASVKSGYGGRGYAIPGRTIPGAAGKPIKDVYPSVTTVLKHVAKGDAFHQWIADQTAAKAVTSLSYLMQVSEEVAWGSLRWYWSKEPDLVASEVREYWLGVRDDAAELGTNIHAWIEADIDGLSEYPEVDSIEMAEMLDGWAEFKRHHAITSHRQEFTLVNDDRRYAGTADADWTIECLHDPFFDEATKRWRYCLGAEAGPYRTLVDLKSSRYTWPEHGFQLAGLANCNAIMREVLEGTEGAMRAEKTEKGAKVVSWWLEDAPPAWERYALLHIRPDDLSTKGEHIARYCVLEDRTEDMDLYTEGFNAARSMAEVKKQLKERAKARGIETEE
jgi:hypothetical protein